MLQNHTKYLLLVMFLNLTIFTTLSIVTNFKKKIWSETCVYKFALISVYVIIMLMNLECLYKLFMLLVG